MESALGLFLLGKKGMEGAEKLQKEGKRKMGEKKKCRFQRDFRPVLGKTEWKREGLEQIERNGMRMDGEQKRMGQMGRIWHGKVPNIASRNYSKFTVPYRYWTEFVREIRFKRPKQCVFHGKIACFRRDNNREFKDNCNYAKIFEIDRRKETVEIFCI